MKDDKPLTGSETFLAIFSAITVFLIIAAGFVYYLSKSDAKNSTNPIQHVATTSSSPSTPNTSGSSTSSEYKFFDCNGTVESGTDISRPVDLDCTGNGYSYTSSLTCLGSISSGTDISLPISISCNNPTNYSKSLNCSGTVDSGTDISSPVNMECGTLANPDLFSCSGEVETGIATSISAPINISCYPI